MRLLEPWCLVLACGLLGCELPASDQAVGEAAATGGCVDDVCEVQTDSTQLASSNATSNGLPRIDRQLPKRVETATVGLG